MLQGPQVELIHQHAVAVFFRVFGGEQFVAVENRIGAHVAEKFGGDLFVE